MSWFWGSSNDKPSQDAVGKLDPELKKYLEEQSQSNVKNNSVAQTAPPPRPSYSSQVIPQEPSPLESEGDKPIVPAESLFQDGRYAHLWKTYQSQASLNARHKTHAEKLSDLHDAYQARKTAISIAALENCAFENLAMSECFRTGGWKQRFEMCRTETRRLDNCYEMQAKFLKALGFLELRERDPDEQDRLQLHADDLYRRMLAMEEEMEKRRKEGGKNVPTVDSMLQTELERVRTETAVAAAREWRGKVEDVGLDDVAPKRLQALRENLKDKTPEQREIEEQVVISEARARRNYLQDVADLYKEEQEERHERRAAGRETTGDMIKRWWGWK